MKAALLFPCFVVVAVLATAEHYVFGFEYGTGGPMADLATIIQDKLDW